MPAVTILSPDTGVDYSVFAPRDVCRMAVDVRDWVRRAERYHAGRIDAAEDAHARGLDDLAVAYSADADRCAVRLHYLRLALARMGNYLAGLETIA